MEDTQGPSDAAPPAAPENWRDLIGAIPARDLFRLLQEDKVRAARVLSGFRGTPDALRHPIVFSRLVEEATRQPQFARELAEWKPTASPAVPAAAVETPRRDGERHPPPGTCQAAAAPPDARLKEKLKDQRFALREKEERIAALETALAHTERERDAARGEAEAAQARENAVQVQADRLRRRQEREMRRANARLPEVQGSAAPSRSRPAPAPLPPAPAPAAAPLFWAEALQRLLSRGKHDVVAQVCREALASGGEGDAALHALYARSLYEQGHPNQAAEQERRAADAYLNAGNVLAAAESFTRALSQGPMNGGDTHLLRRLLALAQRTGQEDAVRAALGRLRGAGGQAFRDLSQAIASLGEAFGTFLQGPPGPVVGPDETISLPTGGIADVTPRRLVAAVEANDTGFVARARSGIEALRAANAPLAEALLQAVATLRPAAVFPLTGPARPVVVDASNVARHDPDPMVLSPLPRVAHLLGMRDFLLRRGFFPILMLADANLRFHVDDREAYLALVERGVVRETLPGTTADAALIAEARERDAPLVTNDRLWEWEEAQEIERLGFAIFPNGVSFASF